jgi:hypothetical protein
MSVSNNTEMKNQFLRRIGFYMAAWIISVNISYPLEAQTEELKNPGQYLFPEFAKAIVAVNAGKDLSLIVNYNIVTEKMVFMQKGDIYDMFNYDKVDTVYLQGKKFIPAENVFYEVALEAALPLYIQHTGKIQSPPKPAAYGGTSEVSSSTYINNMHIGGDIYRLKNESDLTIKTENIYWLGMNGKMNRFLNEKQFLSLAGANKAALKEYIKQNKIKFTAEEDVVKLTAYLNTLSK